MRPGLTPMFVNNSFLNPFIFTVLCLFLSSCCMPIENRCGIEGIQADGKPPRPFKTDGCSMSPDLNFGCCCVEHDLVYWEGGTAEGRKKADMELRQCIAEKEHPYLANVYYLGVRLGGNPYIPACWRWGFGWPYGHGYDKEGLK